MDYEHFGNFTNTQNSDSTEKDQFEFIVKNNTILIMNKISGKIVHKEKVGENLKNKAWESQENMNFQSSASCRSREIRFFCFS